MKKTIKLMIMALTALFLVIVGANAAPFVTGVNVDKVGGEYVVLVSFANTNVSSGVFTSLGFRINELGTTKDFGVIKVSNETVLQYKLSDITNSYNLLKKGSSYTVTVLSQSPSKSVSFLYGNYKSTQGLNLILDKISINNEQVLSTDTLQVMNGEKLKVSLKLSALTNLDNARFMVFMEGYEHNPILKSTDIFSVVAGKTYIKNLEIQLPSDMNNQKDYKLRIVGANDLSGITYKDFNVYVDTQRNRVDIIDLVATPSSGVEAGQNIIANVRLKNRGQRVQDSVKVIVEIPELGVKESSYVSNLNNLETLTSSDMLLFIPLTAKAKKYDVKVTLTYNDGYSGSSKTFPINVLAPKAVPKGDLLVNFNDNVNLVAGVETSFPIVIANPSNTNKAISLSNLKTSWANVKVTPSLAMIKAGDSQTFTVSVTPNAAVSGDNQLSLNVKNGADIISAVNVKTYVTPNSKISWTNLILVVLLILAIIILLTIVIKIARKKNDDSEDEEFTSSKEYY